MTTTTYIYSTRWVPFYSLRRLALVRQGYHTIRAVQHKDGRWIAEMRKHARTEVQPCATR